MSEKQTSMSLKTYIICCLFSVLFFLVPALVLDMPQQKIIFIVSAAMVFFATIIWFATRKQAMKIESMQIRPEERAYKSIVFIGTFLVMLGMFAICDFLIKVEFSKLKSEHIYFCLLSFFDALVLIVCGFGLMKFKMWARNILAVLSCLQVAGFIIALVVLGFMVSVKAGVAVFAINMFHIPGIWIWIILLFYVFDKKNVDALKVYNISNRESFDTSAEHNLAFQRKIKWVIVIPLIAAVCLLIFRVFEYVKADQAVVNNGHKYMKMDNALMLTDSLDVGDNR